MEVLAPNYGSIAPNYEVINDDFRTTVATL